MRARLTHRRTATDAATAPTSRSLNAAASAALSLAAELPASSPAAVPPPAPARSAAGGRSSLRAPRVSATAAPQNVHAPPSSAAGAQRTVGRARSATGAVQVQGLRARPCTARDMPGRRLRARQQAMRSACAPAQAVMPPLPRAAAWARGEARRARRAGQGGGVGVGPRPGSAPHPWSPLASGISSRSTGSWRRRARAAAAPLAPRPRPSWPCASPSGCRPGAVPADLATAQPSSSYTAGRPSTAMCCIYHAVQGPGVHLTGRCALSGLRRPGALHTNTPELELRHAQAAGHQSAQT